MDNNGNNIYDSATDDRYNNVDVYNSPILNKFNWSAFADPIFWGIGNKAYLSLISLVPFFGFFWAIYSGFKGNQWAWEAGNYSSLEEFEMVQSTWNRAGIARFIFSGVVLVIGILVGALVFTAMIATMGSGGF